MQRFFEELSPASRRLRFLAPASASEELLTRLCTNDPGYGVTLVVVRRGNEGSQIIGVGSYFATSPTSAEVAFAVDDRFHGKGIATALLDRIAEIGADEGFEYFSASVLSENLDMLEVFRDSGFESSLYGGARHRRGPTVVDCVDVARPPPPTSATAWRQSPLCGPFSHRVRSR